MVIKDENLRNTTLACCVILGGQLFGIHLLMHRKLCMDAYFSVQLKIFLIEIISRWIKMI